MKRMKTIEAVELYNILSVLKVYSSTVFEGLPIVATAAALREVVDKYNAARETALEQLRPSDYMELAIKAFDSKETQEAGGEATMSEAEKARLKKYNFIIESGMRVAMKDICEKEVDVEINYITRDTFDNICRIEANKDLSTAQLAVVYKIVKD